MMALTLSQVTERQPGAKSCPLVRGKDYQVQVALRRLQGSPRPCNNLLRCLLHVAEQRRGDVVHRDWHRVILIMLDC